MTNFNLDLDRINREEYLQFVLQSSMVDVGIVGVSIPEAKGVWFRTLEVVQAAKMVKDVKYAHGRELIITKSNVRVYVTSERAIDRFRGRAFDRVYLVDPLRMIRPREVVHHVAPCMSSRVGGKLQTLDFWEDHNKENTNVNAR